MRRRKARGACNADEAMNAPPAAAPQRYWLPFRSFAGWRWRDLGPDAVAGLTLAAIAVPEQMATARLAGFPPQVGFIALLAGAVGFAAFGASRLMSIGADFDHRADLRRLAGAAGDRRLAPIRRRRGRAGARGWPRAGARRRARPWLHRRPAVDSGHYRLSRRHRRAHCRQPGAGAHRRRVAQRPARRPSRRARRRARPDQPTDARSRPVRAGADAGGRTPEPALSGRADWARAHRLRRVLFGLEGAASRRSERSRGRRCGSAGRRSASPT